MIDLSIKIGSLYFKNPVMPASGTFGYADEFAEFFDLNLLGAIVTKGLSLNQKAGNKPPRIFENKNLLINSIGLENIGFKRFVKEKITYINKLNCIKIVNFFGHSEDEYYKLAEQLNNLETIDALEANISCPNIKKGGIEFGLNENLVFKLIKKLRTIVNKKSLIVKISPMVSDVVAIGKAIEEAGADAITAINTIKGMAIDINNKKFFIKNKIGGISGPLLKPVAVRIVNELSNNLKIPIIGAGGIFSAEDAIEFLMSGATAIQVGTANFINPLIMPEIIQGIRDFMDKKGFKRISEIKI